MKILILVLSYNDNELYSKFLETQQKTWDSINIDNIETFYYFGNHNKNIIDGNNVLTNVSEHLMNCGYKTIERFKQILSFEFDYIFRTNSSSYIDKKLLKEYLSNKPKSKFYSGIIGNHNDILFCSGSGYVLSKDLVEFLVSNEEFIDHNLIDDVSFGKFLIDNGIDLINSERFDLNDNSLPPMNFFHYRLKTKNRLDDINNMKLIFSIKCKL